jgi:hypothetical protein
VTSRTALARHPLVIAGALITTVSAVLFITLVIAALAGLFANPYAGLVVFVALPALFVMGLLLIPAGMWLSKRRLARDPQATKDWPVFDFRRPEVRRGALTFVALTAVNLVIVLLAGYGSLHWMESPSFCGQVCHTPMHPQFTAWRDAPHAGVACATCHIGQGAGAFVHAKLAGVRQLVHVATNSYPRPIPPGAEMPAGAQARTCLSCHQTKHVVGDRIHVVREYGDDEKNSETMTVMQMHVGAGSSSGRAIHWHADPAVRVEYIATDAARQTIPYVKVTDAKGATREYRTPEATDQIVSTGTRRAMDCVDCHNTVGHPISATAERAVDAAISAAEISRDLPFVRREGVRLVKASYNSEEEAARGIDRGLRDFYASRGGAIDQQSLERTIAAVQGVYRRNVFPAMKVTWGSYPENRSHIDFPGCTRCHDDTHAASDGSALSGDCEYCHKEIPR